MNPLNMSWIAVPAGETPFYALAGYTKEDRAAGAMTVWIGGFASRDDALAWLRDFLFTAYAEQLRHERRLARILAAMPAEGSIA